MAVQFIKASELEGKLTDKKQLVVFYADGCGPCKMLQPTLEELSADYDVFKINSDEDQAFATQQGVQALPTIHFYEGGSKKSEHVGFASKEMIEEKLK